MFLRKSTVATVKLGPFLATGDASDIESDLTLAQADIRLSKNGGNIAQTNNAAGGSYDEGGWYDIPLDTTDTNTTGRLLVYVSPSDAVGAEVRCTVIPSDVYDTLIGGTVVYPSVAEIQSDIITAISDLTADLTGYASDIVTVISDLTADLDGYASDIVADCSDIVADISDLTIALSGYASDIVADCSDIVADVGAIPTAAEINVECKDVLQTDTITEMGAVPPSDATTIANMLNYLYRLFRNKKITTASDITCYDNAGTSRMFRSLISVDADSDFTQGKWQ